MPNVIDHIANDIRDAEQRGARRTELVIIAGMGASEKIANEMDAQSRYLMPIRSVGDLARDYPLLWQWMGSDLVQWWMGELLSVPIIKDPDAPVSHWRVQRLPAVAHPPDFGKDERWKWTGVKWIREHRCHLCGKPADQVEVSGIKMTSCPCVESFARGVKAVAFDPTGVPVGLFGDVPREKVPELLSRAIDKRLSGMRARALEAFTQWQRSERTTTFVAIGTEGEVASDAWSVRLRELQAESHERERNIVTIDPECVG